MVVAFDLDDTLFKEADFVRSAFFHLARRYGNDLLGPMLDATTAAEAFDTVLSRCPDAKIDDILEIYRNHRPDISLDAETEATLCRLKEAGVEMAIITDGRSVTQRHKIEALGLTRFVADENIFISEEKGADKLTGQAFDELERRCVSGPFVYVGDNPAKDFIRANERRWTTVCLRDNGRNIHPQEMENLPEIYRPGCIIESISELTGVIPF